MSKVVRVLASAFSLLALLVLSNSPAYAQGGTTSTLSGIAVDSSGAVLPGADVTVTLPSTGFTQSAVTNADGAFSFPGLNIGTYTVTVKLSGFKTFISNNVVLTSGAGANVRATLEIGGIEEQVVVSSASEIVQTQSTTISSTINTNQIIKLPMTSRSAMDFVNLLPGVSTPGGNRDATINGLPRGTINITLDGVNVQDNTLRSTDGFFAIVSPRLDAIEEVTVTTASQGADVGQGAVQIKFVTRSGTNNFNGSGYWYYRNDDLNANTWFNNRGGTAKANLLQNQGGVRTGGPIVIPGLFDGRNKAFFFVQLRGVAPAKRHDARPDHPAALGDGRELHLHRRWSNADRERAGSGGPERARRHARSHNRQAMTAEINGAVSGGSLQDIDSNLLRYTFNVPVETMRRYPDVSPRLQPDHEASRIVRVQLPEVHRLPGHAEQLRSSLPGLPGRGWSVIGPAWLERFRPFDADVDHGQRGASGLQRRSRHILRGAERRDVHRQRRQPAGLLAPIPDNQLGTAEPWPHARAAVAQRQQPCSSRTP